MDKHKELMKYYRENTIMLYSRYWAEYSTIGVFAEHHAITEHQARRLINIGRAKLIRRGIYSERQTNSQNHS